MSRNDELLIALDAKYVDCVVVAAAQHQVAQDPDNTGTRYRKSPSRPKKNYGTTVLSSVTDPDPFLGLLDPDPLVRGTDTDPDPSIIKQK